MCFGEPSFYLSKTYFHESARFQKYPNGPGNLPACYLVVVIVIVVIVIVVVVVIIIRLPRPRVHQDDRNIWFYYRETIDIAVVFSDKFKVF